MVPKYYNKIPDTYIRKLAKTKGLPVRGIEIRTMISELTKKGHVKALEYLENQFRFAEGTTSLTICRPDEQFPTKSNTPEKFVQTLLKEKWITEEQVNSEWQPKLKDSIQLCGLYLDGNDVYVKMVVAQEQNRRVDYDTEVFRYAKYAAAIIHFASGVIEIRCGFSERDDYTKFLMKAMGFGPKKWHSLTRVTKKEAQAISAMLKGGLASEQIAIQSNVGSLRFNAKRNVDLQNDPAYQILKSAIEAAGYSTDDTMDETFNFDFLDPQTGILVPISIVINLKKGGLRFKGAVTQAAIEHVLEAFVNVLYVSRGDDFFKEVASTQEPESSDNNDDVDDEDE